MNNKCLSLHTCTGGPIQFPVDEILCFSSSRFTCNKCQGSILYAKNKLIHVSERPSYISHLIHLAEWS